MIEYYKNLSLDNATAEIDGVVYIEEWRPIVGWEGYYEVSSFGRIKSLSRPTLRIHPDTRKNYTYRNTSKILRQACARGYLRVCLYRYNIKKVKFFVHRLVGEAFIENKERKPFINHIVPVKYFNFVKNLEWVTNDENIAHGKKLGLFPGHPKKKIAA